MSQVNPNTETGSFAVFNETLTATLMSADTIDGDSPANTVLIVPSTDKGTMISSLSAVTRATVANTALHLFTSSDGGVTQKLLTSVLMESHSVTTSTAIPTTTFLNADGSLISDASPMRIGQGIELYVGASIAALYGIVVTATRVDF